jgi:hypothetical protein
LQPFGDDWNDVDLFKRLRTGSDDLSDILTFALGDPHIERYDAYFMHHRLERRRTSSSSFQYHRDVDSHPQPNTSSSFKEDSHLLIDEEPDVTMDAPFVARYSVDNGRPGR